MKQNRNMRQAVAHVTDSIRAYMDRTMRDRAERQKPLWARQRIGLLNRRETIELLRKLPKQSVGFAKELADFLREIRDVLSVHEIGDYTVQLKRTKRLSPLQRHALRVVSLASAQVY